MAYAVWDGASWVEQSPAMTAEEATAAGAVLVVEPDYPPPGTFKVSGSGLANTGGIPTRWAAWEIRDRERIRQFKLAELGRFYEDRHNRVAASVFNLLPRAANMRAKRDALIASLTNVGATADDIEAVDVTAGWPA